MSHEDWSSKSLDLDCFFHKSKNPGFIVICIICAIFSHSSPPKKLQFLPQFPIQETCELLQSQIPKERCWTFKTLPQKCSRSIDGLKPTYVGYCSPESEVAGKLFGDDNIFAQCTCFKHEGGFCVSFQGTPLFCHFLGRVFLYRAKLNAAQARLTQKGDQQKI